MTTTTTITGGWRDHAACRNPDVDPEIFFTDSGVPYEAKRVCASCPVVASCLDDALSHGAYLIGYRAGTTQLDRRNILRARGNETTP